jgi:hypothetical protein
MQNVKEMQWKIKAEGKINEKGEMKNAECKGNAMENKGRRKNK